MWRNLRFLRACSEVFRFFGGRPSYPQQAIRGWRIKVAELQSAGVEAMGVSLHWEQVRSGIQSEMDAEVFECARELAAVELSQISLAARLTATVAKDIRLSVGGRPVGGRLVEYGQGYLVLDGLVLIRAQCVSQFGPLERVLPAAKHPLNSATESLIASRVFSPRSWLRERHGRQCLIWQGQGASQVRLDWAGEDFIDVSAGSQGGYTVPLHCIDVIEFRADIAGA